MNVLDQSPGDRAVQGPTELCRQFAEKLEESDRRGARRLLRAAMAAGLDRSLLMEQVVHRAIELVTQKWEEHRLSLSQVFVAALIIQDSMEALSIPPQSGETAQGKVVIGTARGDYHGLGKRIVAAFLRGAGFTVVDLGMNIPPEVFVETALAERADVIAVSALMADIALGAREVREAMERRGAKGIKLLVGGAPFRYNPDLYKLVGADATAPDACEAVRVAKRLLEGRA